MFTIEIEDGSEAPLKPSLLKNLIKELNTWLILYISNSIHPCMQPDVADAWYFKLDQMVKVWNIKGLLAPSGCKSCG